MTLSGERDVGVSSYVPPGTSSTASKPLPNSPQVPLQTTFPAQVSSKALPNLAADAGSGNNNESSGIISALLSKDKNESALSQVDLSDIAIETWPTRGRPKENVLNEVPHVNEILNPTGTRSKDDLFNDSDGNMAYGNGGDKGDSEGGKISLLGPKSKDSTKVFATHSDSHLPGPIGDTQHHRDPQPFPLHGPQYDLQPGSEQKTPIEAGRPLQATQSLPVWMPSTVTSTDAPESIAEEVEALVTPFPTPQAIEEVDQSSLGGTPAKDQMPRTTSMPEADFQMSERIRQDHLTQSNILKRRINKNRDNANVRVAARSKLLDRKKKNLLRQFAMIQTDGGVEFDLRQSGQLARDLFGDHVMDEEESDHGIPAANRIEEGNEENDQSPVPPLKIVMLIVGTRGDVQPFVAIGKQLQEYGHRVRLATHTNFRDFVKKEGLEFYPLGGDPKVLAEYMVKNKGFLPSGPSEVSVQRKQIKSIVYSLLDACIKPDKESGVPFRPHAIIANPPAYGHVHVAEYLQIPLHIFFTMPWTSTREFPHPLSRIKQPAGNRMSYQVVDSLIWLGIRGIINSFRKKQLKLRPITYLSGSQGSIADLPTGYIWSPHLVPKPKDWGPLVDVVGFCFLNLAQNYKPPDDLVKWLDAGPPPIYIGFGSLPVADPEGMTKIIIEALEKTAQRGIIGRGWGGIGNLPEVPDNVYLLSDCPHDWLFPRCAAVVHHGGAGTTAAGLRAACPTTIVPFFGDQPFWGERVQQKGVGPAHIPVKHFDLEKLVSAIEFMLDPTVKQAALTLANSMKGEDGIKGAVNVFHKHIHKHVPNILKLTPLEDLHRHHGIFFRIKRKCKSMMHRSSHNSS